MPVQATGAVLEDVATIFPAIPTQRLISVTAVTAIRRSEVCQWNIGVSFQTRRSGPMTRCRVLQWKRHALRQVESPAACGGRRCAGCQRRGKRLLAVCVVRSSRQMSGRRPGAEAHIRGSRDPPRLGKVSQRIDCLAHGRPPEMKHCAHLAWSRWAQYRTSSGGFQATWFSCTCNCVADRPAKPRECSSRREWRRQQRWEEYWERF